MKQIFCVTFFFAAVTSLAAKEPLIHASELASLAAERGGACRFDDALKLIHQAVHEATTASGDAAATLQARLETQEHDLRMQSENVRAAIKDAVRLLADAKVESSEARLSQAAGLSCGVQLRADILARRSQAREWVFRARAQTNPKAVLADLHRASALNAEMPGLGAAIDQAQRLRADLPCGACRVARKTLITVVVLAAAGAGSYYGYKAYQRYELTHVSH